MRSNASLRRYYRAGGQIKGDGWGVGGEKQPIWRTLWIGEFARIVARQTKLILIRSCAIASDGLKTDKCLVKVEERWDCPIAGSTSIPASRKIDPNRNRFPPRPPLPKKLPLQPQLKS